MKALNNLTINTKIPMIVGLLLLLLMGLGGLSLYSLSEINRAAADVRDNWLPSASANGSIIEAMDLVRLRESKYLLSTTPEMRAETMKDIEAARAKLTKLRKEYESLIQVGTDDWPAPIG
jgi:methyl-accepting chemotaxis protein